MRMLDAIVRGSALPNGGEYRCSSRAMWPIADHGSRTTSTGSQTIMADGGGGDGGSGIAAGTGSNFNFIGTTGIAVGGWQAGRPPVCWQVFAAVVNCTMNKHTASIDGNACQLPCASARSFLQLPIPEGKKGARALGQLLPVALTFIRRHLCQGHKVLIHCAQGVDRSATIALGALCAFFDDEGALRPLLHGGVAISHPAASVTKLSILQRQQWLLRHRPIVCPSRANLKALNFFFMSEPPPAMCIWADEELSVSKEANLI